LQMTCELISDSGRSPVLISGVFEAWLWCFFQ
jgi:hypothetical protein